ncbi:inositol monophosphatase family protein [Methylophaga sp. OBS3]|uniref:inositol monophosphatase family protein n=1 Tax=Methylophaga sp. OBS3 TaxID=2991934 RepID=UPI00224F2292|nr:inositol monophosphatase family protein [Methylophaga sp. OBS3]MCX4190739.1 inositol monophosphatase family protein [Methylophaga sp. OBS3]
MKIDLPQLQQLVTITVQQELMPLFNAVTRRYKNDGSVVTIADQLLQQKLGDVLTGFYPGSVMLGEEMSPSQQQELMQTASPLWVLDPIDGTSNFAAGLPFFSVSLALIQNGEVTHGIVYDPLADECFAAAIGEGAWCNGQALKTSPSGLTLKQTIAIVDFKRLPTELATRMVKEKPYGSHRSIGSIALELCWLAAGRAQVYLHAKQHLWDYAAAQLILSEAGGFLCTLDNEPVFSADLTPRSTCAAIDETLFAAWRDYLHVPRWNG